jgi:hypothetical protein
MGDLIVSALNLDLAQLLLHRCLCLFFLFLEFGDISLREHRSMLDRFLRRDERD